MENTWYWEKFAANPVAGTGSIMVVYRKGDSDEQTAIFIYCVIGARAGTDPRSYDKPN
jgi:hypothetical protein